MSGIAAERCGERFASALIVAAAHLRQRDRALHHQQVDLADDQIGHGGTGAAIGNEVDLLAGRLLEQNAAHVRRRVLVDEVDLAGVGLHPGDEIFQIVGRKIFLRDHQLRIDRDQPDRLEILLQVVVELVDDAADVRVPLADVDGVAVGRGARDAPDRDAAAGAADVLDDDRLAERRAACARP